MSLREPIGMPLRKSLRGCQSVSPSPVPLLHTRCYPRGLESDQTKHWHRYELWQDHRYRQTGLNRCDVWMRCYIVTHSRWNVCAQRTRRRSTGDPCFGNVEGLLDELHVVFPFGDLPAVRINCLRMSYSRADLQSLGC